MSHCMAHIWISHVPHHNKSEWVWRWTWMIHGIHLNESRRTESWHIFELDTWMNHVPQSHGILLNEVCPRQIWHICEWFMSLSVMAHIGMSHFSKSHGTYLHESFPQTCSTHLNETCCTESWHTFEYVISPPRVMAHICMSRFPPHLNASFPPPELSHICMSSFPQSNGTYFNESCPTNFF